MCIRDRLEAEYLYWVGCAGSFDDKNQKVTQAVAKLLQRAEVSFAILGPSEQCTGDPARRSGNEYIFQMLAMQNIETLDSMGVKKIIAQCPHCFNTIANEYPQLGGHYEVIHHTELLERLIDHEVAQTGGKDLPDERIVSVIAWSRVLAEAEVVCAINNDPDAERTAWVLIDEELNERVAAYEYGYSSDPARIGTTTPVTSSGTPHRGPAIQLTVPPAGFVILVPAQSG